MRLADNLAGIESRIQAACAAAGRDRGSVRLLPVSKTVPTSVLTQAVALGVREFGENRSQEALVKSRELAGTGASWVMIGHLQRNKVAEMLLWADEFQALDSWRLAVALDRRLTAAGRQLKVLVQVNSSGEDSKFGLPPSEVVAFARRLSQCSALLPVGFMTLARPSSDPAVVAACFDRMSGVQGAVQDATGRAWPELSMGMTSDFELAIAHGSTCVRIGTALFGHR